MGKYIKKGLVNETFKCECCGSEFIFLRRTIKPKYCSKECSTKIRTINNRNSRFHKKQKLLKNNTCSLCHQSFNIACLSFHHLTDKKFALSRSNLTRFSQEEIAQEIKNTVVLCHNCHAKVHHEERNKKQNVLQKRETIYKKEIREKRKKSLIEISGNKCICCGLQSDILDVFSFDHIEEKKFQLNKQNLGMRRWDDILEEVKKCELLCLNCHQLKNILPVGERKIPINILLRDEKFLNLVNSHLI